MSKTMCKEWGSESVYCLCHFYIPICHTVHEQKIKPLPHLIKFLLHHQNILTTKIYVYCSLWAERSRNLYRVAPQKTEQSIFQDFALINSYLFFTLLDRASFPHYNNTKIIKFGWELFILWVISYGLSFSGFARFPEFRGTINDSFGRP